MNLDCRTVAVFFTGLALSLTCAVSLADEPPEPVVKESPKADDPLAEFRTVKQAVKAKSLSAATTQSLPPYLGVILEESGGKLLVSDVAPDSPADKAGLSPGDAMKKFNGQVLAGEGSFSSVMATVDAGDEVNFTIHRDGKTQQLSTTLAAVSRPLTAGGSRTGRQRGYLGVQVESSREPRGTRIQSVSSNSGADRAGLKRGDVIVEFGGKAVPTSNDLVRRLLATKPGDKVKLLVSREKKDLQIEIELGSLTPSRRTTRTPSTREGQYKLAVIGIDYPDQKHNEKVKLEDWQASMFSEGSYNTRNATGQKVYGSVNDYYRELSAGKFGVAGKFIDWIEVSKKREEYKQGSRTALLTEAMDKILERDGEDALDGYDGVFFLYAGARVRTERGGLYWPHRGSVRHNRKTWPYFIMQEGGRRMSGISVMCHEFGHMIGLPDLYSKDARAEGLSVWCAMANQAGSGRPQHFSAWCKERLGWLKPTVIDPRVKQKLILGPVERSSTQCYKVLLKPDGSEYFLLENRRQFGFDASLPSQGLLIWRVVNNRPVLEESHGIAGPSGPSSYRYSVPYPSRSNTSFTPYTTPSSKSQTGGGMPVHITNIKQLADGRITFYIGYEFQ